jgi:hypothetical protein
VRLRKTVRRRRDGTENHRGVDTDGHAGSVCTVFSDVARSGSGQQSGTTTYGPTVQGEVTQKFRARNDYYLIAVNGQPYEVPLDFYNRVNVGMVVKFDGTNWTIISGGT